MKNLTLILLFAIVFSCEGQRTIKFLNVPEFTPTDTDYFIAINGTQWGKFTLPTLWSVFPDTIGVGVDTATVALDVDGTARLRVTAESSSDSVAVVDGTGVVGWRSDMVDAQLLADTAAAIRADFSDVLEVPQDLTLAWTYDFFPFPPSPRSELFFTPTNSEVYYWISSPLPIPFTYLVIDVSELAVGESFYLYLNNLYATPGVFHTTSGGFYFAPGDTDIDAETTATLSDTRAYRFVKMSDGNLMIL